MTWQKESAGASDTGAQRRKETACNLILATLLLWSSGAEAQSLLKQLDLNNKKNDIITVSIRLLASDPDENLEDEGAWIGSSDGSLDVSLFKRWGSDQTFPAFKAQTSDITIWCYGIRDDGDEGCNLAATINGHPAYTPDMKETARKMTMGLGMAGTAMAGTLPILCPAGPLGVAACLMVGATAASMGVVGYLTNKVAGDPARLDYWIIAEPQFGSAPNFTTSMGITREQRDSANVMASHVIGFYAYTQASLISADRAVGAQQSGDLYWEQTQLDYAAHYMRLAAPYAHALEDSMRNVAQYWHFTAFNLDMEQLRRDFNWAMLDANSLHRRQLDPIFAMLGVPWEQQQEINMSLSLGTFPADETGCLGCESLPSKDGFQALYWVADRIGGLAGYMENTYSPQINQPPPPPDDPMQLVLPSWPSCDWYWWQRPDVYAAWPNDCGAAWNHYVDRGQYEQDTYWNYAWGMVCNRAAEDYFEQHPDVRADPYFGQGMWQAFDHFQWAGVWESWNYNWNGGLCQ